MLFQFWLESELRDAIRSLEEGLITGVASITHNGETTVFRGESAIRSILEKVYAALALKIEPDAPVQKYLVSRRPRTNRGL
jgi:hypothetical protein